MSTSEPQESGATWRDHLADAIVAIVGALGLGFLAFMGGVFLGPVALIPVAAGLAWCIWMIVRAGTWILRIGVALAAMVLVGWSLLIVPMAVDMIQHDRIMARVESAVCGGRAPPGSTIVRCKGTGVSNPSNGNQCGYEVDLLIDTQLSPDALSAFYGPTGQFQPTLKDLQIVTPYIESDSPGHARVEFLAIGEEGMDFRCN